MEVNSNLINGAIYENRLKHLVACIPDVFDYKTVLYVGGGNRLQVFDEFVKHNCTIDIVEVFAPNILKLVNVKGIRSIFHSDIETFNPKDKYDVVFFWHGIEHIKKGSVHKLIKKIERYTTKLIVFGCPYGIYEQGAEYGNEFEKHISVWYPDDFPLRGFKCDTIGMKDTKRANLIAWKNFKWIDIHK